MMYRQHKCDDKPKYVEIARISEKISKHRSEIFWYMTIDTTEGEQGVLVSLKIKRCPFCGVNLERLQ